MDMNRFLWQPYLLWVAFTEGVGLLSGLLTREGIRLYNIYAIKPSLTPPSFVFPIVWTILFGLMGVSAARVSLTTPSPQRRRSLVLFFLQLGANVLWSVLFFNLQSYGAAFVWILLLWLLILGTILSFRTVDPLASLLQIPYLLWVTFAAYLNFMVWILN